MRTVSTLAAVISSLGAVAQAAPPARPARPGPTAGPTTDDKAGPADSAAHASSGKAGDKPTDKLDAKALMQSGLKLYAAKDFLGALAVFRTAYTRFPSAKILLNIGTTLTRLDRKAEAANVYQHYLDAADADPAKRGEVKKVLAELDAAVAVLELTVTPGDAELQINDEDWIAAGGEPRHRGAVGAVTVRARRDGYQPGEQTATATAGARLPIALALAEIPPPPEPVAPPVAMPILPGIAAAAAVEPSRSPFGVLAVAHVDFSNPGGAGLFGVAVDLTDRFHDQIAAIVGPHFGGYAGASFAVTGGRLRPIIAAGMPVFGSHGARFAARGAGGVELDLGRHFTMIAELGVEYTFNPEPDTDFKRTLLIPAIGATARL